MQAARATANALVTDLLSSLEAVFDSETVLDALTRVGVVAPGDHAGAAAVLDLVSMAVLGECEGAFRAAVARRLLPQQPDP